MFLHRCAAIFRALCLTFLLCQAAGASTFQLILFAPQPAPQPIDDLQLPQRIEQQPRRVRERRRRAAAPAHDSRALRGVLGAPFPPNISNRFPVRAKNASFFFIAFSFSLLLFGLLRRELPML